MNLIDVNEKFSTDEQSHVLVGDPIGKYVAPLAFTFLTLVSWWFQPDRKLFSGGR